MRRMNTDSEFDPSDSADTGPEPLLRLCSPQRRRECERGVSRDSLGGCGYSSDWLG